MIMSMRNKRAYVAVFVILLTMVIVSPVYADGTLTLDVTIVDPPGGTIQTGQIVEYLIDFSCASSTADCGTLFIQFPLDSELEFIEVVAPPGYDATEAGGVITIVNNIATNPVFDDGEAAQVTVRARVGQDLDDYQIDATVTGTISNDPDGDSTDIDVPGPPLTIEIPDGGWQATKSQTTPPGSVGPVEDGTATYSIEVCPNTQLGVARMDTLTIVDTFPEGAIPVLPIPGGGVVSDDNPPPGNDTITWNFTYVPPHTVDDGCETVSYTLQYPDASFDPGDDITNNYIVTATTSDTPFPDPGTCGVPNCLGSGANPGTVDVPTVTVGGNKSGPGTTAIVAPGTSNGTSVFALNWNLNLANVPTSGLTITDMFPVAVNTPGTPPIIEVTQITSGTWPGGYEAVIEYFSPVPPPLGSWLPIATVDGGTELTFDVLTDFPADIPGIRWRFTDLPSTLPAGFGVNAAPTMRFFVRAGLNQADYDQDGAGPANYHDYPNCLSFDGTYVDDGGLTQNINVPAPPGVCDTLRIGEDTSNGFTNINTAKTSDKTAAFPLEDIQFTLTVELTQEASGDLINPAIEDVLPYGMQIVSWDQVTFSPNIPGGPGGEQVLPYLTIDTVPLPHPITGAPSPHQRLLFYWDGVNIPPINPPTHGNSWDCGGGFCQISNPVPPLYDFTPLPPGANAATVENRLVMTPPATGQKTVTIVFTAQARLDTPAGDNNGSTISYNNSTVVVSDSVNLVCQTGTPGTDSVGADPDRDGIVGERICTTGSNYEIREAAQMRSEKWIRSIVGPFNFLDSNNLNNPTPTCPTYSYDTATSAGPVDFTRYPCVAQGTPNGDFEYLMRVQNTGLVFTSNYVMYDILPNIGDVGVSEALVGDPRNTEFLTYLTGPIVIEQLPTGLAAGNFTIEYYVGAPAYRPCRPQMSASSDETSTAWHAPCGADDPPPPPPPVNWLDATAVGGAWDTVTAFRIRLNSGTIVPGGEMVFSLPMRIIDYIAPFNEDDAETGEIAWNSFAQRFNNDASGARLLTAEPRKVGITVVQNYSVGNRVWIDDGIGGGIANNGQLDGGELGIDGVRVELWQGGVFQDFDITHQGGYYFFGNLPGGNNYRIVIPASQFQAGGPLDEYHSSTGNISANNNNNNDSRDNGIDPATFDDHALNGVRSTNFSLTRNDEAINEPDLNINGSSGEGPEGRGSDFEEDEDSDLTIDFGFYKPMSLGNIVWIDDGAGGGGRNNGLIDGSEAGINGVTVELHNNVDVNGVPVGPPIATDTTANGGYYLFEDLPPGPYYVHIPATNFTVGATPATDGPLAFHISSVDGVSNLPIDDNNDNGINDPLYLTNGITSAQVVLTPDSEPLEDPADKEPGVGDGEANNGTPISDDNSDLTIDFGFFRPPMSLGNIVWRDDDNDGVQGSEPGIQDVTVGLYADANADGVPDGAALATTITDANGFYLFDQTGTPPSVDNLEAGRYLVVVEPTNFGVGNALEGFFSSDDPASSTDETVDLDDNGVGDDTGAPYPTGVSSQTIVLIPLTEPPGEVQGPQGNGTDIDGNPILDENSNLTIDFGFYQKFAIGNRVWLDEEHSATVDAGDGIMQPGEIGIGGVVIELYLDAVAGDDFDPGGGDGAPIATTTTTNTGTPAEDGYYYFDDLPPGNYYVYIPSSNFDNAGDPLWHLYSSDGVGGFGTDNQFDSQDPIGNNEDENGDDLDGFPGIFTSPTVRGIASTVIELDYDSEPTIGTETDRDPNLPPGFNGAGVDDDNSDFTVDFGFYGAMSIGNRVFYDANRNGYFDGTDTPIPGVTVFLYRDDNGDGTPDGPPIATQITDGTGYYLFDETDTGELIREGGYVIGIDPNEFNPGQELENFVSTETNVAAPLPNPDDTNDNGIDQRDVPGTPLNQVFTGPITLQAYVEPTDDDDPIPENHGRFGIRDENSNLTYDFGFYIPLSLGNRVWQDSNNNQVQDPGESGINGVLVNLYQASAPGVIYRSTVTVQDSFTLENGYYLFDDLPEGDYIVEIDLSNFLPGGVLYNALVGGPYFSSEDTLPGPLLDSGVDLNDNGIDDPNPAANGIQSNPINLALNTEPSPTNPADDLDLNTDVGEGTFGELDVNAEMTVDFGFYIPAMSLGNRVFFDYDNNRQLDGSDIGTAGVTVNLFMTDGAGNVIDQDGDGGSFADLDDIIATDLTDANGYYIFDGLQPGFYVVVVDENNFRTGGVLQDYYSSQDHNAGVPDTPTDAAASPLHDNDIIEDGIDSNTPELGGIRSPEIELVPGDETPSELDLGPEGNGEPNIEVTNSNLTIDFGFYKPMSIGNRVWFDTDADGLISVGESGIAGVTVNLYEDDGDGNFDPAFDTLVQIYLPPSIPPGPGLATASEQTDANGYYLFDNLAPGNYFVQVDPSNWNPGGPLEGIASTVTGVTNPPVDDSNDNGTPDGTTSPPNGVFSAVVSLVIDSEPNNEADLSLNFPLDGLDSIGRFNETDENSDITIDFGFLTPNMSLGNRVWYDGNRDGLIDGTDDNPAAPGTPGIANVTVSLYRDGNSDGIPDGPAIATDVTDPNGYYLFENLAPGNYLVGVDSTNFATGPLVNLTSTTTDIDNLAPPENAYPPVDDDSNDNGDDVPNPTYGILSNTVTLTRGSERLDEGDLGPDGDGTGVNPNDSDLTVDFGFFEPMSIGNRVWFDLNNDGQINAGENGVPNVVVRLYQTDGAGNVIDQDSDGGAYTDDDDAIAVDTTDANGYYLFDGLPPGDYLVVVDEENFGPGRALIGTVSSNPFADTTTLDNNDNGIDSTAPLDVNGVPGNELTLVLRSTPVGEVDLSNNPTDGPAFRGNNGETDNNADLTMDFGFFPTSFHSIGNRVWLDDGGTTGIANNGLIDGDEVGIAGVTVSLYLDVDSNGQPDGAALALDTTDANGYYLFDGLPAGNYIVALDAPNFQTGALVGYASTLPGVPNPNPPLPEDSNDNRVSPGTGTFDLTYGIYSDTITLTTDAEPVGETDLSGDPTDGPASRGNNGEQDDDSDLTIDFGFIQSLSLGNRVWFDFNNNGLVDAGETGIPGVEVLLFRDDNLDGIPDDLDAGDPPGGDLDAIQTDFTDSNGYYMFNGLLPGNYLVGVNGDNFTVGNPLEGFSSSTGDDNTTADINDNGIDTPDAENNILSGTINLTNNLTPVGETDLSGQIDDGPNFRGANNESDNNSDMTVDFGFFAQAMSLGNVVWFDTDGNGLIDGGESGIAGVTVELFADTNGDGVPDGAVIATDITDTNGYYLFDALPPGQYVVRIAPANFGTGGPLDGFYSTVTGTPNPNPPLPEDSNDNGIDNPNPTANGILSGTIDLVNPEPVGETDLSNNPADGPDFWGNNGETDDNSDLTIDFGFTQVYDWGDAPDTYGTNNTAGDSTSGTDPVGASHRIIPQLQLGVGNDNETSGQPSVGADGDDLGSGSDDEDGIVIPNLVAGTTVNLEVTVLNDTGTDATFVGWIDWDGNGTFDPGEAVSVTVPPSPTPQIIQVPVNVPLTADTDTGGSTYARFRLTTDPTINGSTPTGPATDGEVEDYRVLVGPPGLSIVKTDGQTTLAAGQSTTYTVTISNSSTDRLAMTFRDNVPTSSPNGFDPATVTWTCTPNANASCVAGAALGTGNSGTTTNILETIDVMRNGVVTYQITATLRNNANAGTIINIAELPDDGLNDDDVDNVIFAPPGGQKSGVATGNVIRWTQQWINDGGTQTATITDTLPSDQTFLGNLICTTLGTSTTTSCVYNAGTITWTGTIDTGYANRVVMAFDVTVPGDGTYTNSATLDAGTRQMGASGQVQIGGPPSPGLTAFDPAISKVGSPLLAAPGEIIVWTIEVANPGQTDYPNAIVTDSVAPQFEILGATTTLGTIDINGQDFTLYVDPLPAGTTVTITVETRMRGNPLPPPFYPDMGLRAACTPGGPVDDVFNIACVQIAGAREFCVESQVFCRPQELPATGETPRWREAIPGVLGLTVVLLALVGSITIVYRRKAKHSLYP